MCAKWDALGIKPKKRKKMISMSVRRSGQRPSLARQERRVSVLSRFILSDCSPAGQYRRLRVNTDARLFVVQYMIYLRLSQEPELGHFGQLGSELTQNQSSEGQ